MLILRRNRGQCIIVDDHIKITVLEAHNQTTKIGIEAPDRIKIYREELIHRTLGKNHEKYKRT